MALCKVTMVAGPGIDQMRDCNTTTYGGLPPIPPIVISAAPGPQQAHNPTNALSALYRREGSGPWQLLQDGLPAQQGTLASVIGVNRHEAGRFYVANNQGIFRSTDTGRTWEQLPVVWPDTLRGNRPQALVVVSQE